MSKFKYAKQEDPKLKEAKFKDKVQMIKEKINAQNKAKQEGEYE